MTSTSKKLTASLLVIALLPLSGCAPGTPVKTLEGIITAAEILFPFIAGPANIPPALQEIIQNYLQAAYTAVGSSATILADSSITTAQKVSAIVHLWANVARPNLPQGTPTNIVNAVEAVSSAILNFLGSLLPPQPPQPGSVAARGPIKNIKLSSTDQAKLEQIKVKANVKLAKIRSLRIKEHPVRSNGTPGQTVNPK